MSLRMAYRLVSASTLRIAPDKGTPKKLRQESQKDTGNRPHSILFIQIWIMFIRYLLERYSLKNQKTN